MSLYLDYRPKDFDSLHGQTFVKEALLNALRSGRTVGAYLFHGSRGTGKTTVARILAKAFNCLDLRSDGNPCGNCANCRAFDEARMLDIIEIDAASNTGVDNIREMIEKAQFQPNEGKYKVYIIDEVHMLSKGAFNALLKTLEEPPAHVKFILATTEIHRIPETIISRSQRYDFRRITEADIISRLWFIAQNEKIDAEESGLELIAKLAKWGLRDAISLFEQYAIGGVLRKKFIEENLALVGEGFLSDFLAALANKDAVKVLEKLADLKLRSIEARRFFDELLFFMRDRLVEALSTPHFATYERIFRAFESAYGKLRDFPEPFLLLEITSLSLVNVSSVMAHSEVPLRATVADSRPAPRKEAPVEEKIIEEIQYVATPVTTQMPESLPEAPSSSTATTDFDLLVLINHVKAQPGKGFVLAALKNGDFTMSNNTITFGCSSEFERKKLDTPEIQSFLWESIELLFGMNPSIAFSLSKKKKVTLEAHEVADIF